MKNGSKVLSNLIWRFLERCGAQGVKLIVELVLARILLPEDYGTIALVTVFITILNVFVDSGMANALIQKKDADDIDFSTVFYFNMCLCMVLYLFLYVSAPLIGWFYENQELISVLRVLGITILISGVKNVQQAYVSKTLQFKKFFFATLGGTLGAAVIGIVMAYKGFGVWALVAQQLFNTLVDTIILWITVKWRPIKAFSFQRLKSLFAYGWKLLVSSLLDTVYNNFRQLIIGKFYTSADLAFYNKGEQFPNLIVTNINSSIDSVLLPVLSNEQGNVERVKEMTRRSIKTSVYVMGPLMVGLFCVAPELVELVLTKKWLPCVPFLRICCISYLFYPIHTANLNAIKAMGRSDLFLKMEIVKKIVGTLAIIIAIPFGVMAMAYSLLIVSVISQVINSWPNKDLLRYSYFEQMKDIIPSIVIAILMGISVEIVSMISCHIVIKLCLQVLVGICIYIALSILCKNDSYIYILDKVKSMIKK